MPDQSGSDPRLDALLSHPSQQQARVAAQVKKHWVGTHYWRPGPSGNDIHKTNVPNLRMRFRYDCHQEELGMVVEGARAHEARQAALAARADAYLDA